jgi:ornithine carbamoyltransferase
VSHSVFGKGEVVPKDFLALADWKASELHALLNRADELKRMLSEGEQPLVLQGKTLALYFEKPSLRTRVTFEVGMAQLGGATITLQPEQVGLGQRESVSDVARGLSRWVDGIMMRTFSHDLVCDFAQEASIPVINGLTDRSHPCQAMADLQTVAERIPLGEAVIAYVGDGNNVAASLLHACSLLGAGFRIATPASHKLPDAVRKQGEKFAQESGSKLLFTSDPVEAVQGANFVYTDVWTSMGQEEEAAERRSIFAPYQVNAQLLSHAPEAFVLHCLPAHRGEEISAEVLEGPQSIVFDQAENRLHAQKAILERILTGS